MATLSFQIKNVNNDQVLQVVDLKNARNVIFEGPINNGDTTDYIRCWIGGDFKGRVEVNGSVSGSHQSDIRNDDEIIEN